MELDLGAKGVAPTFAPPTCPPAPTGLALTPFRPNSEPKLPREGGTEANVIVVDIIRTNPLTRAPSPSGKRSTSTLSLPRTLMMQATSPEAEPLREPPNTSVSPVKYQTLNSPPMSTSKAQPDSMIEKSPETAR